MTRNKPVKKAETMKQLPVDSLPCVKGGICASSYYITSWDGFLLPWDGGGPIGGEIVPA